MQPNDFDHHEQCPECAKRGNDTSGDNLGVFTDGHKFCFCCQYYVPAGGLSVEDAQARLLGPTRDSSSSDRELHLPRDYTRLIRPDALARLS